jgi:hypothetical protein
MYHDVIKFMYKYLKFIMHNPKNRSCDRRLSAKLVSTFAD